MHDYDLEKIINNCPNNPEFILYLTANNEDESLHTIYEYEIYGDLLDNLLDQCKYDFNLVICSLGVINNRPYITKEMVHNNLKMSDPIPFARKVHMNDDVTLKKIYYYFEANNFYINYKQKMGLNKKKTNKNKSR